MTTEDEKKTIEAIEVVANTTLTGLRKLGDEYGFCGSCQRVFKSDPEENPDFDCPLCGSQNTIY